MTEVLVIRMAREDMTRLDSAAKKRSQSRSAFVRELLRKELKAEKSSKGVGWPERLRELQKKAIKIKGHPEDEIREMDRNRWR
jgi:predicted DNA-binding protein